jgi:ATP-dependent RNA helicase RhlE
MIQKFNELELCEQIQENLIARGYETPSPIQAQSIPHLLEGKDLLGCAQTGTGKTGAFALPILNHLYQAPKKRVPYSARVLVLTPTRELAVQVAESFETYGRGLGLKVTQVFGGVGFGPQKSALRHGTDILVACPGRLLDLRNQGCYQADGIDFLVLDEADRMLDMGFAKEVQRIVAEVKPERQTILFSATMPQSVMKLASSLMRDPVEVKVDPVSSTAEKVEQSLCFVKKAEKRNLLRVLMLGQKQNKDALCLVFSRTKHGANRLVTELGKSGVRANAIHGNKSQGARQRALEEFKSGKTRVLVATDVAARGIDVKGVTLVVNFDMPIEPEAYVHRIGRTARAGREGQALSFCCDEEFKELAQIERLIQQKIRVDLEQPLHDANIQDQYEAGKSGNAPRGSNGNRPQRSRRPSPMHSRNGNRSGAPSNRNGNRPRFGKKREFKPSHS